MKKKLALNIVIAAALVLSACAHRVRESDLDVSPELVDQQLAAYQSIASACVSDNGVTLNAYNDFMALKNTPGATLYYTEAGGDLGKVSTVTPLEFDNLSAQGTPSIPLSKTYAYFVTALAADGFHGALILASTNGLEFTQAAAAPAAGTTTTTTAGGCPVPADTNLMFHVASNTGQTVSTVNTGAALSSGSVGDADFTMGMNMQNRYDLTVQSLDIVDGDLADVIQLDVYQSYQGAPAYIGKLNNMVQVSY